MKAKIRAILDAKSVGAVERKAEREAKRLARKSYMREYAMRMRNVPVIGIPKNSPMYRRQNKEIAA